MIEKNLSQWHSLGKIVSAYLYNSVASFFFSILLAHFFWIRGPHIDYVFSTNALFFFIFSIFFVNILKSGFYWNIRWIQKDFMFFGVKVFFPSFRWFVAPSCSIYTQKYCITIIFRICVRNKRQTVFNAYLKHNFTWIKSTEFSFFRYRWRHLFSVLPGTEKCE